MTSMDMRCYKELHLDEDLPENIAKQFPCYGSVCIGYGKCKHYHPVGNRRDWKQVEVDDDMHM